MTEKRYEQKRAAYKTHYQKNRQVIMSKNRQWATAHPEKFLDYSQTYREKYPEKVRAARNNYVRNNKDAIRQQRRQYRENNSTKDKEYRIAHRQDGNRRAREWQARFRANHPEENRAKQRLWRQRNPETYRANQHRHRTAKTAAGGSYTKEEWSALLDATGHRCLWCNKTGVKLTVDHVIPVSLGGKSSIDNLQPLCASCNSRKHGRIMDFRKNQCR